nr:reverse transcriptase domain-containing protein [Tanacetum cinerariifolium]
MRTRSRSRSCNNSPQREASPVIVEPICIELLFLENQFQEDTPPESPMADNRTMTELLQAPTEGYEDTIVIPEITANNFELKHAWERFNDLLRACPHHGFSELHQLDTFYNALNFNDQDSLNSVAGGNFLDKMPRECLKIIESKSKVRQSRAKAVIAKVGTSSSTPVISSNVAKLKDMVKALLLDRKNQSPAPTPSTTPAPVKAVEANCVTCGGTLPGNTVTNPKEELKGITTRSGVAYQGPKTPSPSKQGTKEKDQVQNPSSQNAAPVQPSVTQSESQASVSEPVVAPVRAPMPNLKPSIPYPSRRDNEKRHLGASINLMPLSVWEGLSLPEPTPTCMTLELADRSVSKPIGNAKDVSFKVGVFHFHGISTPQNDPIVSVTSPTLTPFGDSDFLLFEEADAFIGLENDPDSLKINPFFYDPKGDILLLEAILNSEPSPPLPNQEQNLPSFKEELKAYEAQTVKSSVEEPPEVELKDLPHHLEYVFLEGHNKLPVNIAKELRSEEKTALIKFLKSHKRAIAWKLSDIQGINPEFCTHKILIEEDYKPTVQHQRRVNPKIHDVIKKEVEKLLDAGLIYPISDSPWVSPVHCVPKKSGFTVVENEENELIPTRLVTEWRVCIDYRKLNEATQKYHFPLPYMDQMLERLAGNEYYCFLNGFSGTFKFPLTLVIKKRQHSPAHMALLPT